MRRKSVFGSPLAHGVATQYLTLAFTLDGMETVRPSWRVTLITKVQSEATMRLFGWNLKGKISLKRTPKARQQAEDILYTGYLQRSSKELTSSEVDSILEAAGASSSQLGPVHLSGLMWETSMQWQRHPDGSLRVALMFEHPFGLSGLIRSTSQQPVRGIAPFSILKTEPHWLCKAMQETPQHLQWRQEFEILELAVKMLRHSYPITGTSDAVRHGRKKNLKGK
jgi:hypothetical protein